LLVDVFRAYRGWGRSPPSHWLIAAFVGFKPRPKAQYMTPDAARDFMMRTGGRIPGVQRR
jgi:hypothetical protein